MKQRCVALIGHVGNSVFVRGGLEVHLDSVAEGLADMGHSVIRRLDDLGEQIDVAIFFGAFYGNGGSFQALEGIPRITVPILLHSDNSMKAWRLIIDPMRSKAPGSLLRYRRQMIMKSDFVIPSSNSEALECIKWGANRVKVIPVPINLRRLRERLENSQGLDEYWRSKIDSLRAAQRPIVLSVGRLELRKNQLSVVEACEKLEAKLVVIGRRSPTERDFADRLGVHSRASHEIWEDAPDSVVAIAMSLSDVHVLASNHETAGLVSLEAAAQGARPVAIRQATSAEYLSPFGELSNSSSAADLAIAISAALSRGRLSRDECQLIANFDITIVSRQFNEVIEEALSS